MRGKKPLAAIAAIAASALFAVIVAALSPGPTPIRILNRTAVDLHDVVLTGSGFQHAIAVIAAGSSLDIRVSPRGESSLSISYTAEGREKSAIGQGYFEGGGRYRGSVVIHPDHEVTVAFEFAAFRLAPFW